MGRGCSGNVVDLGGSASQSWMMMGGLMGDSADTTKRNTAATRGRFAGRFARPGVAAGLAASAVGIVLLVASPFVGTPAGAAPSKITITRTAGINAGPCIGQGQLGYTVLSDSSIFRLRIFASAA